MNYEYEDDYFPALPDDLTEEELEMMEYLQISTTWNIPSQHRQNVTRAFRVHDTDRQRA